MGDGRWVVVVFCFAGFLFLACSVKPLRALDRRPNAFFYVFFSAEVLFRPLPRSRGIETILSSAPERKKDEVAERKRQTRDESPPSCCHFRSSFSSSSFALFKKKNFQERDGHVSRVLDDLTRSSALELDGNNAATTSITCPPKRGAELGITLPHLAFLLRAHAPGKGCSLEVEVRDDRGVRRRIRASTFQPVSKVAPGIASLPLRLEDDESKRERGKEGRSPSSLSPSRRWHRVPLDLDALVRRAWGTRHRETLRVTVHACCRLRRVYFSDRGYEGEGSLPPEYRLYVPASAVNAAGAGGSDAASRASASVSKAVPAPPPSSPLPAAAAAAAAGGGEEGDGDGKEIPAGVCEAEVATGEVAVGEEEEEGGVGGVGGAAAEATAAMPVA